MALVVNTNVSSLNAQRQLNSTTNEMSTAMERLSSGKRINSAADDAAGLAISTRMTSQVKGLTMAIRNANDGISLVQTAEGALDEVTNMLQRMRELSVQSSNVSNNAGDREALNAEVGQLQAEIDRIASTTRFNNQTILDGSYSGNLQIGDQADQTLGLSIGNMSTSAMGETPDGLAQAATAAALTIDGISTNSSDYQGKSFEVVVNGVTSTVTLPTALEVSATRAAASVAVQGEDTGPATSFAISTDSFRQATVDLTTATDRVFQVRGLGDEFVNVDFSQDLADLYGVTIAELNTPSLNEDSLSEQVTADDFIAAINSALSSNDGLQGENAVSVSLNSKGFIEFANSAGSTLDVAVREGYTADPSAVNGTFLASFVDSAVSASADGTRNLGIVEVDLSSDAISAFKVKVNGANSFTTIDILSKLNDTNYVADRNEVMGYELVNLLQDAFDENFTGDDAVTVGLNLDGELTFSIAGGDRTLEFAEATYDNAGTSTAATFAATLLGSASASVSNESNTVDLSAVDSLTEAYEDDDYVLNVRVNTGPEVNIDMQSYIRNLASDTSSVTGDEMVSILQAGLNDHFSGDDAVTVGMNSYGQLTFDVAAESGVIVLDGADMDLSGAAGSFVTSYINTAGALTINQAISSAVNATTEVSNAGTLTTAYGSFNAGSSTAVDLVDFAVQNDATRLTPFDDVSKTTIEVETTNVNSGTMTSGDVFSFVLDDGVSGVTITADALTATLTTAELATLLDDAVDTMVAADPDSGASRYDFEANGSNGLYVHHVDGRTFTIATSGSHSVTGTAEITVDGTTGVDLSTTAQNADEEAAVDLSIAASSTYAITLDGVTKSTVTVDSGDYHSLEDYATALQYELDASGDFEGEDAINVAVRSYSDETAPSGTGQLKYLTFENAAGKSISVDETNATISGDINSVIANTNIYQELGVEPDKTSYQTHGLVDGGVDTTAGNGSVSFEVNASGNTYSYQLAMSQDSNRSFADFSEELLSKANEAFAEHGLSFSGGLSNGQFSIELDQAGESTFEISGAIIDDAFGGTVSGVGTAPISDLSSMDAILTEINADLEGSGAVATFDESVGQIVFSDASGNTGATSQISVSGADLASIQFAGNLSATGVSSDATSIRLSNIDISSVDGASEALTAIDNAIEYISSQRADLGAVENRLTHTINNLSNVVENTSAARSRIQDADFAVEAANLAKAQVMQQAGTAMLAQANASAQSVLSLLG